MSARDAWPTAEQIVLWEASDGVDMEALSLEVLASLSVEQLYGLL